MPLNEKDAGYIWDMFDTAKTVYEIVSDIEFDQYNNNKVLKLAVERAIEIIGEAARHISDGFRQSHPEIPWQNIIGQRNILAHQYGDIDQKRIWNVAKIYIPDLIIKLNPLIPQLPPEIEQ
jgi:uncharacterized protein with HEPN domain